MPAAPEREPFPRWIDPMLLSSGQLPPNDESWVYELKWDGMRAQLAVENGAVRLRSRACRDWTAQFPELRDIAAALGAHRQVILDGELVCLDGDGKPDFERLRARLVGSPRNGSHPLVRLMIFDVLHLDGFAVRALPYWRRRELLDELGLQAPAWSTPRTFTDGVALACVVAEQRLEGVVAKRLDRAYVPGSRSATWVKHKCRRRTTCVITGVAPARSGQPEEFLLARADEQGRLRPAGRASFGLTGSDRARLLATLAGARLSGQGRRGGIQWLEPCAAVDVDHHGSGWRLRDQIIRSWRPLEHKAELAPEVEQFQG